jgi:hypothetical protein
MKNAWPQACCKFPSHLINSLENTDRMEGHPLPCTLAEASLVSLILFMENYSHSKILMDLDRGLDTTGLSLLEAYVASEGMRLRGQITRHSGQR